MYYRYILTTITTITTVSAVAIPPQQGANQHQAPNQVYGQRPGVVTPSQSGLYSTVPIVIPTPHPNGIPEPRYERKQDQFKSIDPQQNPDLVQDHDRDHDAAGRYQVGKPSSSSLQPSQIGRLPPGPSGIPMGHGPVVVNNTSNAPVKRDVEKIQDWPAIKNIHLGPGPVVLHNPTPAPTGAGNNKRETVLEEAFRKATENVPEIRKIIDEDQAKKNKSAGKRDEESGASKTVASWPSLSGVPLGHGPVVFPGRDGNNKREMSVEEIKRLMKESAPAVREGLKAGQAEEN